MRNSLIIALVAAWLGVCGSLMLPIFIYDHRPGLNAQPSTDWPVASKLMFNPAQYTIVAFMHPQCPCSHASLGELEQLLSNSSQSKSMTRTYVVFIKPSGCTDQFVKSALFKEASAIKGVTAVIDEDGRESQIFDSKTSGQLLIYSPNRRLVFEGGITGARGHFGDNDGLDTASAIIAQKPAKLKSSAVYGCPLFASNEGGTK